LFRKDILSPEEISFWNETGIWDGRGPISDNKKSNHLVSSVPYALWVTDPTFMTFKQETEDITTVAGTTKRDTGPGQVTTRGHTRTRTI